MSLKIKKGMSLVCFFTVPKKLISLRAKTVKSSLTDEQRRAAAERLKKDRRLSDLM